MPDSGCSKSNKRAVPAHASGIRATDPKDYYLGYHAPRYAFLLNKLDGLIGTNPAVDILDVGRSVLTKLIYARYQLPVDTLGLEEEGNTESGRHYSFDLIQSQDKACWRVDIKKYDIIILAEVIEHLYISPSHVLGFLKTLLKVNGVLIVQTPNAVDFKKRLKMLFGLNPFELIRKDLIDPGHYREYTRSELIYYAKYGNFEIKSVNIRGYFDYRYFHYRKSEYRPFGIIDNVLSHILPFQFQTGITLILKNKPPDKLLDAARELWESAGS